MEAAGKNQTEKRLYEASLTGDVQALNQLMRDDPLILARSCITSFNETPLHIASMLGHLGFVNSLVSYKPDLASDQNSQGFSPLHLAAANGYLEIVKVLVTVNPDSCLMRDEDGMAPLHLAVVKGRVDVVGELMQVGPEVIRYKIDRGETVLHLAAKHNRLGALKLLVESEGGDEDFVNATDDDGNTVLHMAVSLKQIETVKYLLGNTSLKVNAVNRNGLTALDITDNMPRDLKVMEIREFLLNAGASRARKVHTDSEISTNAEPVARELGVPVAGNVAAIGSQRLIKEKKNKKGEEHWAEKSRGFMMVAASVIAAITYQAAISPPGGFWDRNSAPNDPDIFRAGTARWATMNTTQYNDFFVFNTIAFLASLTVMFMLVSGFQLRKKIFSYILMAIMWAMITVLTFSYLGLVLDVAVWDQNPTYLTFTFLGLSMVVWLALIGIVFLTQCIRIILRFVKKGSRAVRRRNGPKGEAMV